MKKNLIQKASDLLKELKHSTNYTPIYRVVAIEQDAEDEFTVTIQIINKNITFKAKPEEILAKDNLVDQFSPRDIRALTYLGYLGIHSPKYKVLAQRLSDKDNKLSFTIKHKGDKKIIVKTAGEIMKEKEILDNLNPNDAHLVGYTVGSEIASDEKRQKEEAIALSKKMEEDQANPQE